MEDTTSCPICGNKLRTISVNTHLHFIGKTSDFFERTCSGPGHSVQFFTDKLSKSVDMLKFSLDPKYSSFLEIDYVNNKCRIYCMKKNVIQYIYIPKMVETDFPNLDKLKERISMYVVFS